MAPFKMKGSPMKRNFGVGGSSPLMDKNPHTGKNPPHSHKKPTFWEEGKSFADDLTFGLVEKFFPTSTTSTPTTPPIPPPPNKLPETPGYADVDPFKPINLPKEVEAKRVMTKKKKKKEEKDNKPKQYLRDFTK